MSVNAFPLHQKVFDAVVALSRRKGRRRANEPILVSEIHEMLSKETRHPSRIRGALFELVDRGRLMFTGSGFLWCAADTPEITYRPPPPRQPPILVSIDGHRCRRRGQIATETRTQPAARRGRSADYRQDRQDRQERERECCA